MNGRASKWGSISAGVPQGSILGPLFFLVYINDLTANIRCDMKLFADDTSLFRTANDLKQAAVDTNNDLTIVILLSNTGHINGVCSSTLIL